MTGADVEAYERAQRAILELKRSIHELLATSPPEGLQNAEIGRALGIYMGHAGHEGHIPRVLLGLMENEGAVVQDPGTKRWRLRSIGT